MTVAVRYDISRNDKTLELRLLEHFSLLRRQYSTKQMAVSPLLFRQTDET